MIEIRAREYNGLTATKVDARLISEYPDLSPSQRQNLIHDIFLQLAVSSRAIERTASTLDKGRTDSDPPTSDGAKKANMGGWVGVYPIRTNAVDEDVVLRVIPRVGLEAFDAMLSDIRQLVVRYGPPALEIVARNTFGYPSLYESLLYSIALNALTEAAFAEGLPYSLEEEVRVGEIGRGKVAFQKTLQYYSQGLNICAYKRRIAVHPDLPLWILGIFHMSLLQTLMGMIRDWRNSSMSDIVQPLCRLRDNHLEQIVDENLSAALHRDPCSASHSVEMLEEARNACGTNRYLREIVDLYEAYLSRTSISFPEYEAWEVGLPLLLVPGSKVYELWILTMLERRIALKSGVENLDPVGQKPLQLGFQNGRLVYGGVPRGWSKMISKAVDETPRPDYILAGNGTKVVADAKYREQSKVRVPDVERLLAYLLDCAERTDSMLAAFFVSLRDGVPEERLVVERNDLSPKASLYAIEADPRHRRRAEENLDFLVDMAHAR